MSSDLGVEALDEKVNQLLQEMQGVPLATPASATNHLESSTSTWYEGNYPLCRRPGLQYHFLKPSGQDIKLCSLSTILQTTRLLLRMPSV